MKKISLFFAMLMLVVGGAWATNDLSKINFAFAHSTAGTCADVTTVTVTDNAGAAIDGVTATLACNKSVRGVTGQITSGMLVPDANTTTTSATSPFTFTLTVSGLPSVNVQSVTTTNYGTNGGNGWNVDESTASTPIYRQACYSVSVNSGEAVQLTDVEIPSKTEGASVSRDFDITDAKIEDGNLVLTLNIWKGTSNGGCFYALSGITLNTDYVVPAPTDYSVSWTCGEGGTASVSAYDPNTFMPATYTTSPVTFATDYVMGASFVITPNDGYEVDAFTVGGVDKKSELKENSGKYAWQIVSQGSAFTANCTLAVTFKGKSFDVTYSYQDSEGNVLDTETISQEKGAAFAPTKTILGYTYTTPEGTVTKEETVIIVCTAKPFLANGNYYIQTNSTDYSNYYMAPGETYTTTSSNVQVRLVQEATADAVWYIESSEWGPDNNRIYRVYCAQDHKRGLTSGNPQCTNDNNIRLQTIQLLDNGKYTIAGHQYDSDNTYASKYGLNASTGIGNKTVLYAASATSISRNGSAANANAQWTITAYVEPEPTPTTVTANMNIQATLGCATFCAPFDVTLPEDAPEIKVYTAEMSEDNEWIKLNEVDAIKAGTCYVLYCKDGYEHNFEAEPTTTDTKVTTGCLIGNLGTEVTQVAPNNHYYVLQCNDGVTGWYYVKSGTRINCGVNRCYLNGPSPTNARAFYAMSFGEATGINNIAVEAQAKADGKYLVNGKMVVVKAGKAYNMSGQIVK